MPTKTKWKFFGKLQMIGINGNNPMNINMIPVRQMSVESFFRNITKKMEIVINMGKVNQRLLNKELSGMKRVRGSLTMLLMTAYHKFAWLEINCDFEIKRVTTKYKAINTKNGMYLNSRRHSFLDWIQRASSNNSANGKDKAVPFVERLMPNSNIEKM